MQDAPVAAASSDAPDASAQIAAKRHRRRVLAACAAAAIGLHLILFGGARTVSFGSQPVTATKPPMSIRTVDVAPRHAESVAPRHAESVAPAVPTAPVDPVVPALAKRTSGGRAPTAVPLPASPAPPVAEGGDEEASARIQAAVPPLATARSAAGPDLQEAPTPRRSDRTDSSLLAPGEEPPPVYPTRLPPAATLHYQVRRGVLAGTGDIRWVPSPEGYRLVLESRIAGLVVLRQSSEGGVDEAGLAPNRFVDERARRGARAANFRREAGTITFSGPAVEWPLLPGSQDRLSWMIQLAGIAAAAPERLVEGGRIAMIVVGARGEASLWTLRCAGRETVETVRGHVTAIKLVRDGRSTYDTSAEVWLDPERDYLPVRATLRNGPGDTEFDLLLERIERP